MMMHVKRVYVIRIVTKTPKLHAVGVEGEGREGRWERGQTDRKERERGVATHRNAPTTTSRKSQRWFDSQGNQGLASQGFELC